MKQKWRNYWQNDKRNDKIMNMKRNQIKALLNFLTGCELMKSEKKEKKIG